MKTKHKRGLTQTDQTKTNHNINDKRCKKRTKILIKDVKRGEERGRIDEDETHIMI